MARRQPTLTVTIDDRELRAYEGETILDAARRLGADIPTLCYLDGLSIWGGCRVCVVEVAGEQPLRLACATPVVDDMEIRTTSPTLHAHRKNLIELLFAEGNHICSVCVSNGACELQDLAVALDVDHIRFAYQFPARQVDATHDKYVFDPNRCILCTRCVRTCAEIEGAYVWEVASRGEGSYLVTDLGEPWGEADSCTSCGKCVAVCPTGALFDRGRSIGEMRHDTDVVDFLATARRDHEWREREGKR